MRKAAIYVAVFVSGIVLGAASLAFGSSSRAAKSASPTLSAIYKKVSSIESRLGTIKDVKPHGNYRTSLFGLAISMETDVDLICHTVKGGC